MRVLRVDGMRRRWPVALAAVVGLAACGGAVASSSGPSSHERQIARSTKLITARLTPAEGGGLLLCVRGENQTGIGQDTVSVALWCTIREAP
jgi:hypothetical protein